MKSSGIEAKIAKGVEQRRIDAYIVKRVSDVTHSYDKILEKVLKQGERIMSDPSDQLTNSRSLCIYLGQLIQAVLIDLWKCRDTRDLALKCIYDISYMQKRLQISKENFGGYPWNESKLFKKLTQPFAHSRTLMGMEGSRLIMELVYPDFHIKNYELQITKGNSSSEIECGKLLGEISSSGGKKQFWSSNSYEFKYLLKDTDQLQYKINLLNKTGGVQFGGVFEVMFPSECSKRYYCKAYWGYPAAKGNFNSEKAFTSSISFVRSSDIRNDGPVENAYNPLDFKELFIYKVLEYLEIGPKAHFFKVPVLKDGFFIMTEDLSTSDSKFIEVGKMDTNLETLINVQLLDVQNGDIEQESLYEFNALIGLLELDTINRIFKLHDSNDGNFGYMVTTQSGAYANVRANRATAQEWLKQKHEFKIVDFIAPSVCQTYIVDSIFNTFLAGNTVTKYLKGHLMDLAICRHFDDNRGEELKRKHEIEKIFFGMQVIQSLEKRFAKYQGFEKLLNNAKQYIQKFLENNKCEEISDHLKEEGLCDIDKYIEGIICNYNELKKGIEAQWKKLMIGKI